jgi:predicted nucleotidyltransferase
LHRTYNDFDLQINDALHLLGCTLDKTLRLLHASYPVIFEWLFSPVVYQTTPSAEQLKQIANHYFSAKTGFWHYLHLTEDFVRNHLQADLVEAANYLHAIRTLLASRWILHNDTAPPVLLPELIDAELEPDMADTVRNLLNLQQYAPEGTMVPRDDFLNTFLDNSLLDLCYPMKHYPAEHANDWSELDQLNYNLNLELDSGISALTENTLAKGF